MRTSTMIGFLALFVGLSAHAEVSQQTASSFTVTQRRSTDATPSELVAAIGTIGSWWEDGHTYSQHASNLQLDLQAGGCFCERWDGGSVEHARVVYVNREQGIVRLVGALGPLRPLAVSGVLTFAIETKAGKSQLVVTYRIGGADSATLEKWPNRVDQMMGATTDALSRYLARKR